jgi:hypothetical protein
MAYQPFPFFSRAKVISPHRITIKKNTRMMVCTVLIVASNQMRWINNNTMPRMMIQRMMHIGNA